MTYASYESNRGLTRLACAAAGVLAALSLAGCGGSGKGEVASVSAVPAPEAPEDGRWAGRDRVKEAIALLNKGDPVKAREHLMKVLKKTPGDTIARQLVTQIDSDPKTLLGSTSYSYTLKDGESLSSVAQEALGNPMMFYALARYNDIAVPEAVGAGQTILVPGERPAPARAASKKASPKRSPEAETASTATPEPVAPTAAAKTGNPAQAAKFRGQGLAALNSGAIDQAVSLLRRAHGLDPSSTVIKGDLDRALRVQNTVKSRP